MKGVFDVNSDYYSILGLPKGASLEDIKKSYRKLALQYHPDRNPGDKKAEETFKKISEAYAVLSDPEKKKQYDLFGDQKFHQNYSSEDIFRGADFHTIFREFDLGGGDFFSRIFSGSGFGGSEGFYQGSSGRRGASKGQDVEYPLTISFLESYNGAEKNISYRLNDGSTQDFKLKVPAGVREGAKLRVAGKGAQSPFGGKSGDLYVVISVAGHPDFSRTGNDIETPVLLKLSEALLGCSKEVTTLEGKKRVKIPAGVKPGTKVRLKGLGFPEPGSKSSRGDLYAVVQYDIPNILNKSQLEAVEQLSQLGL